MWHASVSIYHFRPPAPPPGKRVDGSKIRAIAHKLCVTALDGVGSEAGEWWWWNPLTSVGHFRVPTTADEVRVTGNADPEYQADAGTEGTWRSGRTRPAGTATFN